MKKLIPELLAPAGSMDALKAAVNAGADAVYLAGKRFGARYYAANFEDSEIKEAVEFAHLRGVKVYVTVNTLIKQNELNEVAKYLIFLHQIGVDAIIVQDLGVAFISKKIVPDLNLHASTQMTIHNLEGVKWAAEMGFRRVVLAREMEISEIIEISEYIKSKEIELEIFAHGALCYSYSGQCLMSSLIGGRSGNRGMCAQPCRKQYELVFGKKDEFGKPVNFFTVPLEDKYLLSTRDLFLYEYLDKIVGLNVGSLKIEGRMRSPEYVAIVVNIYRKALDSIRRGRWIPLKDDIIDLKLAFNRDFTGGYVFENNYSTVMGRDLPGNRGIYLGSVINHDKEKNEALIRINGDIVPENGDGVVFISSDRDQKDFGISIKEMSRFRKNMVKFKVQRHLKPGSEVYLTRSKSLLNKAQKIIKGSNKKYEDKIPVDLGILIQKDGTMIIECEFSGQDGSLKLQFNADFKMEKAIKRPLLGETIIKQFIKTGATPFIVRNIDITYPGGLFAPLSELNRVRRDLFEKIKMMIINSYIPSKEKIKKANDQLNILTNEFSTKNLQRKEKTLEINAYIDNLKVLKAAVLAGCKRIYFNPFNLYSPLECNFDEKIKNDVILKQIIEASSFCKENNVDFTLKLPKITSTSFLHNLKPLLIRIFESGINEIMVDGMGAAKFILDLNPGINLLASSSFNVWNGESLNALQGYFKSFTISPELSKEEIQDLISNVHVNDLNIKLELIVQGNMESLISRDCLPCLLEDHLLEDNLFLGIRDAKNHVFPLRLDNECRTFILNSVELSLIDYTHSMIKIGMDSVSLDLQGRSEKYAQKMCFFYIKMIQDDFEELKYKKNLNKMKKQIKNMSWGGITTGNFLKGTSDE
ncbi:MAG: DUF3656 domain-containing U32 family peptidase [Methanobacterium sp.]